MLFWDIKGYIKSSGINSDADYVHNRIMELSSFDLNWSPSFKQHLVNSKNHLPFSLSRFSLSVEEDLNFVFATEEGQLLRFNLQSPSEFGLMEYEHFGPITTLHQSPFFPEIFLSAGDWTINIWKSNIPIPLVTSPCANTYITAAQWSPTRPGVFFVGKANGSIEMWDFIDKSHAPSIVQNICSPSPISSLSFLSESIPDNDSSAGIQLLAVGDNQGRLHILEVPRN